MPIKYKYQYINVDIIYKWLLNKYKYLYKLMVLGLLNKNKNGVGKV